MSDDLLDLQNAVNAAAARPSTVLISYANDRPAWWRRHRRVLILGALLAVACYAGWRLAMPVYRKVLLHVSQTRASHYQPPGDFVVFREVETTGQPGAMVVPKGDQTFEHDSETPTPWFELARQANLPFGTGVFLGSRDAGKGERIVYVRQIGTYGLYGPFPEGSRRLCVSATVLKPGGWTSPPIDLNAGVPPIGMVIIFPPARTLSVMAGQADASDAAHFTIRCVTSDTDGKPITDETLDGYLRSDDTVQITPRSKTLQVRTAANIP